jgi:hypothetical protein
MYSKIGMFGGGFVSGNLAPDPFMGDQIRGFGFNHDGTVPDLFRFVSGFDAIPANPVGIPNTPEAQQSKRDMVEFQLAFDSNHAPIVGQQVTLTDCNDAAVSPRIALLIARADAGECDLVAKGRIASEDYGFVYVGGGHFAVDLSAVPPLSNIALKGIVASTHGSLTYTCAPVGSGERIGVDRDLDGYYDGDERNAGSDPADATSTP